MLHDSEFKSESSGLLLAMQTDDVKTLSICKEGDVANISSQQCVYHLLY
jgi:hypothetical protein